MLRRTLVFLGCVLALHTTAAQTSSPPGSGVVIRGDTSGAPSGCTVRDATRAIQRWFRAVATGDSAAIVQVVAAPFVFSNGNFTPKDAFFAGRSIAELAVYARRRSRAHEQMTLSAVTINEWRGRKLEFYDVAFTRTADDLGSKPLQGIGKGEYECGRGLRVLNLAMDPRGR